MAAHWSIEGEEESKFKRISVQKCSSLQQKKKKQPVPLNGLLVRHTNVRTELWNSYKLSFHNCFRTKYQVVGLVLGGELFSVTNQGGWVGAKILWNLGRLPATDGWARTQTCKCSDLARWSTFPAKDIRGRSHSVEKYVFVELIHQLGHHRSIYCEIFPPLGTFKVHLFKWFPPAQGDIVEQKKRMHQSIWLRVDEVTCWWETLR